MHKHLTYTGEYSDDIYAENKPIKNKKSKEFYSMLIIYLIIVFSLIIFFIGYHTIDNAWNLRTMQEVTNSDYWLDCSVIGNYCLTPNQMYNNGIFELIIGLVFFGYGSLLFGRYKNHPCPISANESPSAINIGTITIP
jgi:hypothetical protein